jgi:hypothetical protein
MALMALMAVSPARAQIGVPAEIVAAVSAQLQAHGIPARAIAAARALYRAADLTPAAAPDWLVDFNVLPVPALCSTGGCPLQIWVKAGAGPYQPAFDRPVLSFAIDNGAIDAALPPDACAGQTGCRGLFRWHGGLDGRFENERAP